MSLLDPVEGSPKGINFFIKLIDTCIKKLQRVLDATKVNKTGSEVDNLTVPNGYKLSSQFNYIISPSNSTIYEDHTFDSPSELFEGVANDDVYIDYLSIGAPMSSDFLGLRKLSIPYFADRCRLDAAKFTPLARFPQAFGGAGSILHKNTTISANIGLYVHSSNPSGPKSAIVTPDALSKTGYSYLTPSVVEFSDPSDENKIFDFYYTAFNLEARENLISGGPITTPAFANLLDYERLLISLMNYSNHQQNYIDAGSASPLYVRPEDMPMSQHMLYYQIGTREVYKNFAEQTGLTLHDDSKYNDFFNKEAGATKDKLSLADVGEQYPILLNEYSDTLSYTHDYIRAAMATGGKDLIGDFPTPALEPYAYSTALPNSFKFYKIFINRTNLTAAIIESTGGGFEAVSPLNEEFDAAYTLSPPGTFGSHGAFLFFQQNLTSKIEVFRGASFPKDDENPVKPSWTPLVQDDLGHDQGHTLFCRIVLYDQKFSHQINVPILDKYFLIVPPDRETGPASPNIRKPKFDDGGRTFWESRNHKRINDFRTMTEKGMRDTRMRDPLPENVRGPDPDPTRNLARGALNMDPETSMRTGGPARQDDGYSVQDKPGLDPKFVGKLKLKGQYQQKNVAKDVPGGSDY